MQFLKSCTIDFFLQNESLGNMLCTTTMKWGEKRYAITIYENYNNSKYKVINFSKQLQVSVSGKTKSYQIYNCYYFLFIFLAIRPKY